MASPEMYSITLLKSDIGSEIARQLSIALGFLGNPCDLLLLSAGP